MKALVIAPHMDDEALGCGGTVARHVDQGDEVYLCFIAHRVYGRKFDKKKNEVEQSHAKKATDALGFKEVVYFNLNDERLDVCIQDVLDPLEKYVYKIKPQVVYCPFRGDNHQDHRAVFGAVRVALRPSAATFVKKLLMYEVPSSTEQSPPLAENAFMPNYYVDIAPYIEKKLKVFRCYETESRAFPHPRSEEAIRNLAQRRGIESGLKCAEAFMLLKETWT